MRSAPEDVHLISPWAPSGVAWLLNALLELGVPIFRDQQRQTWIPDAGGMRLSDHEVDLKRHLPSLSRLERFHFRTTTTVRWSHDWPSGTNVAPRVILCVRDGADALVSLHRRFHAEQSLREFLRSPSQPMFAPPAFKPGLWPAQEWALFTLLWAGCARDRITIVRFEDLKTDPVRALKPALAAIGVDASDDELARAAFESSFEKAKAAEERLIAANPSLDRFRANHSGKLGESRERFGEDEWGSFAGLPALAQRRFGYRVPDGLMPADAEARVRDAENAADAWLGEHPGEDPAVAREALAHARSLDQRTVELARTWTAQLVPPDNLHARRTIWRTLMGVCGVMNASTGEVSTQRP